MHIKFTQNFAMFLFISNFNTDTELKLEMLSAYGQQHTFESDRRIKKKQSGFLWQKMSSNVYIDGLEQERRNSIANALELRLSCTNPSTSLSL